MKLGSLFDGIGGFPLSATLHGIEPVWAREIEKFPIEVTKIRFPNMKHLGDITNINGAEIEPVDIITFGSPCQDLSVAGKREGLVDGKRSNLFYQAVRIIREMREATNGNYPTFAVWENVPGAFSSNGGQDFRSVLEEITESEIPMPESGKWATAGMARGNGRSAAWRILDAQHWGVPQRRKRIFLVADFAGQRAGEILFECESVPGDIAESRKAWEEVAAGARDGTTTASGDITPTVSAKWAKGTGGPSGDECQNLVAFACNQRQDKNGPQGSGINEDVSFTLNATDKHAVVYPINTQIATRHNALGERTGLGIGANGDPAYTLQANHSHAVAQLYENHGQDSRLTGPLGVAPTVHRKYGTGGNNTPLVARGFEGDIARTLTARHDSSPCVDRGQDLVFAIRTAQLYENHAVRSFTSSQFGQYQEGCGTLRANGGDLGGGSENLVSNNYTVRRLTPTECERLQGFPDNWTSIPGASDTGRYKALGNSVAVPCVAWIMGRIKGVVT